MLYSATLKSRLRQIIPVMLLMACASSLAQEGSAIISLVMPPPGADGYAALQTGGAIPSGAASLYYNPALLTELERSTGSQLHFTHSSQKLLPTLNLSDLNQNFSSVAFVIPDKKNGFDVGVGFFRNKVNFGTNLTVQDTSAPFNATEAVYALGIGIRLGMPISVGATAKYYDSRLSSGEAGRATGWAFDWGILASPTIHPLRKFEIQSLEVIPSIGLIESNVGGKAVYDSVQNGDPISKDLNTAIGVQIRFANMIEFSTGQDINRDLYGNESNRSAYETYGYSLSVLGLRFSEGWLDDPKGERFEKHTSLSYEFNLLQVTRIRKRFANRDLKSSSVELDKTSPPYPYKPINIWRLSYRLNPRFVIGKRWISSNDNGIRDGQEAWYWSVSL